MKIGLCLPYTAKNLSREVLLDWIRRVDQGPFSAISCGERMVGSSVDMMAALAAAAAITERVRIVPTLYVLPMHPAIKVAKHAATLDLISGGRTTIAVGIGGRIHDYMCMEKEPVGRHARMDEQVAQIRRIWAGEIPFEGAEPVGPHLVQPGGPPILAGVMGPKAIARAARWADGFYSWSGNGDPREMGRQQKRIAEAWADAGRESRPERVGGFWYSLGPDADERLKTYVYDYLHVMGDDVAQAMARHVDRSSADAVRASLDAYEELGLDECWLSPASADEAEIDELLEVMEKRG